MGRFHEAVAVFKKSLDLKKDARTFGNLASAYAGFVLDSNDAMLFFMSGLCDERKKNYPLALKKFQQALKFSTETTVTISSNFACGKIYDRLHESEQAYQYFVKGNQLALQSWHHEPKKGNIFSQEVDTLLEKVTPSWVQSWQPLSKPVGDEQAPIFLVGFPRSGTTLLAQIFASHPDIQLLDETVAGYSVQHAIERMPAGYPAAIAHLQSKDITDLQQSYYHAVAQIIDYDQTKRLLDKMPLNMSMAPMLIRLFPQCHFVFIVRHPCDACFSCFMNSFDYNSAMANFVNLSSTVSLYIRLMRLWQNYNNYLNINVHQIRYEDLIGDFDGQVKPLLQRLNLPWDDNVRNYHQHAKASTIRTPSYKQASQKIYQEAKYRWLRYQKQLAPYMEQLEPFIRYFGYDTHNVR